MLAWLKSLFGAYEPVPSPGAPTLTPLKAALERWRRAGRPAEQVTALEALAALGGPEARETLEAALQDVSSVHAQIAAARLLGELGDPAGAAALERVLTEGFWVPSREGRARGHSGLGIGPAGGLDAARQNEKLVRAACENALKKLKSS